jgi:hypothetical protein
MFKEKKLFFVLINIIFFTYYSVQLLIFTDEFAIKNIGFFNHAVAGLSELLGIIFAALSIVLIIIFFKGLKNQFPIFLLIFIIQIFIAINFWRYVVTNSPGESNIKSISLNAIIFSTISIFSLYNLIKNNKTLYF